MDGIVSQKRVLYVCMYGRVVHYSPLPLEVLEKPPAGTKQMPTRLKFC